MDISSTRPPTGLRAFYNDNDKSVCRWLEQLMNDGLITPGVVSDKPIQQLRPEHIAGFDRVHFFAGIAGWDLALNLAKWGQGSLWTGSCPCQPYSSAGKRKGQADERDLWPDFARLIGECRPPAIFGEQVASAIRMGWLDRVCADLEGLGYAVGAAVLGAHSVGAPHIRQRLWWVANLPERLGDTISKPSQRRGITGGGAGPKGEAQGHTWEWQRSGDNAASDGTNGGLGHTERKRCKRHGHDGSNEAVEGGRAHADATEGTGAWSDYILVPCADGKTRRLEPSIGPLVDGVPARVVRLRGYGNAIVPTLAAAWIEECMSVMKVPP